MSGEGGAKSQVVLTIGVDVGDRFSQMPDTRSGWRWRDSGGGPYSHHSSGVRPVVSVGDIIPCGARRHVSREVPGGRRQFGVDAGLISLAL